MKTLIQNLGEMNSNRIYIKREDLIPISFGGNKARKAQLFFQEIDNGKFDCVITYGTSSSNHCRIVSNMAAMRNMDCYIISPQESSIPTYNSKMMELFGAEIVTVPVEKVHKTIEAIIQSLRERGRVPYFIPGGGHGNIGTQAYVNCYKEILMQEKEMKTHFDYIFFASGTGTTHAGLICGKIINGDDRNIIGISIARKNPRGRQVVYDSVNEYLNGNGIIVSEKNIQPSIIFDDTYTGTGYAKDNEDIRITIKNVLVHFGIPMDSVYVGKAFSGMNKYIKKYRIRESNILFLHTGGTPLFFDEILKI